MNISTELLFISTTIFFIVLLLLLNKHKNRFRGILKIDRKSGSILIIILILSLVLNIFVVPHFHRWYTDEPNIMEVAKIFITKEDYSQIKFRHPSGWPFLLSFVFMAFGLSSKVALYASSILGSLTVVNVYLITRLLTKKEYASIFSAFIYTLIPVVLTYAGTTNNNIPSTFFVTLSFVFILWSMETKNENMMMLTGVLIGFTAFFRAENYYLYIFYGIGLLIFKKMKMLRGLSRNLWFIFIIILLLPNLLNNVSLYFDDGLAAGNLKNDDASNWATDNFSRNKETFQGLIGGNFHPFMFTIIYLLGIFIGLKEYRKQTIFLLFWIIPLILSFALYFHVPSRFLIGIYPFLAILAGFGLEYITRISQKKMLTSIIFSIIIIITFLPYIKNVHNDIWAPHSLESIIPDMLEKDLKEDCTIIAVTPTIIKSTTRLEVINSNDFVQKNMALNNPCTLFFEDMYCDGTFDRSPDCSTLLKRKHKEYLSYTYDTKTYKFYQLY